MQSIVNHRAPYLLCADTEKQRTNRRCDLNSLVKSNARHIRTQRRLRDLLLASLAFLACPGFAWAEASAIAFSSDKQWGWATRATQQEANTVALQSCNKVAKTMDCKLDDTKAIVRAEGKGRVGIARSSLGLDDAKKRALQSCGKPDCKVVVKVAKPGFYSVAEPDEGDGNYFIAYHYSDSDKADAEANQGCFELNGKACRVLWSGAIAGTYTTGSAPAARPSPVASERNCRPNTPTIRCSSQCTNGDCTVTYENGCKMRVQVQPLFDSFSNQWTYPAPSC
ncbi:DUF4189 domain-containing protein [Niveibacterium microcysteis]|uniref:DUF4189 domain-containing protein n=1 Tax=Niveibacterium microcysteis TaxID=2811415 RepID=A0ABX7M9R4_9RHOO|nr:DUF4189 domain-containing protein [Niveibacterium microcysteis]QSI78486.1 DUF4189 domain-containing protein [Niveibacterium microcysteis]